MKYAGMPMGMWLLFEPSFRKGLRDVLGMDRDASAGTARKAKAKYRQIIGALPDFEKGDRGYEARFTQWGICTLMGELGLYELVPAMCRLDYTMSEAGGVSEFVREYTLASGGPYCDCGYRKKQIGTEAQR